MSEIHPEDLYLDEFLNQDRVWYNRTGVLEIDSMPLVHRRNAALFLLRKSPYLAAVTLANADPEPTARETFRRLGAPQTWVRTTVLYQRLIQGGADPDQFWAEQKDERP